MRDRIRVCNDSNTLQLNVKHTLWYDQISCLLSAANIRLRSSSG